MSSILLTSSTATSKWGCLARARRAFQVTLSFPRQSRPNFNVNCQRLHFQETLPYWFAFSPRRPVA